jgi:hypothetical protein
MLCRGAKRTQFVLTPFRLVAILFQQATNCSHWLRQVTFQHMIRSQLSYLASIYAWYIVCSSSQSLNSMIRSEEEIWPKQLSNRIKQSVF